MNRLAGLFGWEHLSHMVVQYHFCSQMKSPCFRWYSWFTNGCFPQVMRWLTSFVSQSGWWFLSSLPVIYLPFITFNLWTLSVSIKHFGIIWPKIFEAFLLLRGSELNNTSENFSVLFCLFFCIASYIFLHTHTHIHMYIWDIIVCA